MTATVPVTSDRARRLAPPVAVVAGCALAAVASLPLPSALTFDAHGWLVWGREVGDLALDTTGGPSWKPLPVLVTSLLAPLGTTVGAAAWSVVARTGALLALVGTYRLATRSAGRPAGVIAAIVLVLSPDGDPRFLRLLGEGHVAPTTAACAVWAVDRHLDGDRRSALVLAFGAALIRPEAWPFLLAYGVWSWRREPDRRPMVAGLLAAVPLLWFGGDWWGAGSPFEGAATAQVLADDAVITRFLDAFGVLLAVVIPAAWIAAVVGWRLASRPGERWLRWSAVGAALWAVLVVGMAAVLGYAALSRFFLPLAAVVAVLAGVGAVRAGAWLWCDGRRPMAAALGVLAVVTTVPRVSNLPSLLDEVAARAPVEDDLDQVLDEVGRERLLACDELAVDGVGLLRMGVAWKLDLPVGRVGLDLDTEDGPPSGVMLMRAGGRRDRAISRQDHTTVVLRSEEWAVLAVNCPSAV